MKKQIMQVECKKLEKANTLQAVFSTADTDRHGDIVVQNWELENYKSNPVILNSHNQYDATEVIGKATSIEVKEGKLQGEIEFAVEANPKAKVIHDLYAGGFLKAFSVGFIPKEWADSQVITLSELLEISAVSVPANAMALAKAKGIDVDILKSLQDPDEVYEHTPTIEEKETDEETVDTPPEAIEETPQDNDESEEETVDEPVEEVEETVDEAVEDTTKSILKAVQELREEQKGRSLSTQRKKEINQAIRELLKAKKL